MIGAVLRLWVSSRFEGEAFPVATLLVNVLGSFGLGVFTFLDLGTTWSLLLGVGVCGSFTTFSSFSVSTVRLWEMDKTWHSVGFATSNILDSLGAIGLV